MTMQPWARLPSPGWRVGLSAGSGAVCRLQGFWERSGLWTGQSCGGSRQAAARGRVKAGDCAKLPRVFPDVGAGSPPLPLPQLPKGGSSGVQGAWAAPSNRAEGFAWEFPSFCHHRSELSLRCHGPQPSGRDPCCAAEGVFRDATPHPAWGVTVPPCPHHQELGALGLAQGVKKLPASPWERPRPGPQRQAPCGLCG